MQYEILKVTCLEKLQNLEINVSLIGVKVAYISRFSSFSRQVVT